MQQQRTMRSHPQAAQLAQRFHSWERKSGFVQHLTPLPRGPRRGHKCQAPGAIADGSPHVLKAPGGAELTFTWVARELAWARWGGHRLAYSVEHLGEHGWTYVGPA